VLARREARGGRKRRDVACRTRVLEPERCTLVERWKRHDEAAAGRRARNRNHREKDRACPGPRMPGTSTAASAARGAAGPAGRVRLSCERGRGSDGPGRASGTPPSGNVVTVLRGASACYSGERAPAFRRDEFVWKADARAGKSSRPGRWRKAGTEESRWCRERDPASPSRTDQTRWEPAVHTPRRGAPGTCVGHQHGDVRPRARRGRPDLGPATDRRATDEARKASPRASALRIRKPDGRV